MIRFIDPVFDQTGGCDVAELLANEVCSPKIVGQHSIVLQKFCKHGPGSLSLLVAVSDSLVASDVSDGVQGISAQLSGAFGNWVSHRQQLIGFFLEQAVVIMEMWTRHMPIKVLSLDVECKDIGEEPFQLGTNRSERFASDLKRTPNGLTLGRGRMRLVHDSSLSPHFMQYGWQGGRAIPAQPGI